MLSVSSKCLALSKGWISEQKLGSLQCNNDIDDSKSEWFHVDTRNINSFSLCVGPCPFITWALNLLLDNLNINY